MEAETADVAPLEPSKRIFVVRDQRALLDLDLAELYAVNYVALERASPAQRRPIPGCLFMRLTNQEVASLRSHFAILKTGRGQHRKYPLLAFTEDGAVMAATILSSPRAAAMSVYIVRAFVRLRSMLETNAQLARKLDALEKSVAVMAADTKRQSSIAFPHQG